MRACRCRIGLLWLVVGVGLGFLLRTAACAAQATPKGSSSGRLFEFHSGFWINLHHFLYLEAQSGLGNAVQRRPSLNNSDAEEVRRLSADERVRWDSAVAYYRDSMVPHDLLFNRGMESIKNQLEDFENSSDLTAAAIPEELKSALRKAAPIYRQHWWAKHDAENRQWIDRLEPLIEKHGETLRRALEKIYDTPWSAAPVRVDVVAYANLAGAYTSLEPTRSTISSTDPANQETAALEIVFHEASHGMMNALTTAIRDAETSVNSHRTANPVHFRRDLWHEVLFYTTGALVADRIPDYVPYADRNALWKRAWPEPDRSLIERDWNPHIKGSVGLQQAVTRLVDDLAATSRPQ